jgi:hypothetical protein
MTVRIALPVAADTSSLAKLYAGTSCEYGVNGEVKHQTKSGLPETDVVATHFSELPTRTKPLARRTLRVPLVQGYASNEPCVRTR